MGDIRHIDPKEFRQRGFLQEANRLFFHPHGLALELTTVDGDGDSPTRDTIVQVLSDYERDHSQEDGSNEGLASLIADALYPPGSARLSGIWDYRDDPEGIVFGSRGCGDSVERASTVAAERAKHAEARKELFGADSDIEPLDWTHSA